MAGSEYQDCRSSVPLALDRQPAQVLISGLMTLKLADSRFVEETPRISIFDLLKAGLLGKEATARIEIGRGTVGFPPRTEQIPLRSEPPNIFINEIRVAFTWDEPMPGVGRPWFCCPHCGGRRRHIYLLGDAVSCWRCFHLQHFCRSWGLELPGTRTVLRLRKRLGASGDAALPFSPMPERRRGERREFYLRTVAAIIAAERRLLVRAR